jgi:hypothetical protein
MENEQQAKESKKPLISNLLLVKIIIGLIVSVITVFSLSIGGLLSIMNILNLEVKPKNFYSEFYVSKLDYVKDITENYISRKAYNDLVKENKNLNEMLVESNKRLSNESSQKIVELQKNKADLFKRRQDIEALNSPFLYGGKPKTDIPELKDIDTEIQGINNQINKLRSN